MVYQNPTGTSFLTNKKTCHNDKLSELVFRESIGYCMAFMLFFIFFQQLSIGAFGRYSSDHAVTHTLKSLLKTLIFEKNQQMTKYIKKIPAYKDFTSSFRAGSSETSLVAHGISTTISYMLA